MTLAIAICARNAAATIERAIASCLPEPECPILLVDDHSTDDTVARARTIARSRLTVVSAPNPGGVSMARQAALDAIDTDYAAWLDADDEWVPRRAERLLSLLCEGADVAVEAIDLHDGASGRWLRRMTVPAFVRKPGGTLRLFERNFLPGDTQVAFRTATFREAGGYDGHLAGSESMDILLRAIARGARFAFDDEAGYRMYAYDDSLSRNLVRLRPCLAVALRKHTYIDIFDRYMHAGFSDRVAAWALVSVAMFRDEPEAALDFVDVASPSDANPREILEPSGPWPFVEGWRRAFFRGTALLRLGGDDSRAAAELMRAEAIDPTAEGANNLGVALARLGHGVAAQSAFQTACARLPTYRDAWLNRRASAPAQITTHPLRRAPSRSEYRVASA